MTVQARMRKLGREARTGLVLLLTGFLALGPAAVYANPEIQEVVQGQVEMNGTDQVDVTNGSIANYTQFDISADESFRVEFVDAGEIAGNHLARVVNGFETLIHGELTSNGHVYLVNPAGITISPTGKVGDMPGFHAAAGDMKLDGGTGSFGPRTENIDSNDRFINLTGAVVNQGEINAEVVDLIGRYVENSGSIHYQPPDPGDPLNGYFVLAAGEDVIVVRSTDGDGRTSISLRIPGAAREVLDALEGEDQFGIELVDGIADIDIDAQGGAIALEARVATGAGDLFGTAIHFGAGSETSAEVLAAEARGADLVLGAETGDETTPAAELEATEMTLCAGEVCQTEEAIDPDDLAAIRAPVAATLRLRTPVDPDGEDGLPGTDDDLASQLSLSSDAELGFDDEPESALQIEAERQHLDLTLLSTAGLTLGDVEARNFAAGSKLGEAAGLPRLAGNVSIDPDATIAADTVLLEGSAVEGVAGTTFDTERIEITQADALVIDKAYADAVSEPDPPDPDPLVGRSIHISSFETLDVTDVTDVKLAGREIELRSGLIGGDLTIGEAVSEDPDAPAPAGVQLSAHEVTLSATLLNTSLIPSDTDLLSSVVVHDNARITSRGGSGRVPDFSLTQEAPISAGEIPTRAQLGEQLDANGDNPESGTPYSRSYTSTGGFVTVDEEAAGAIFGPADVGGDFSDTDLALTLDSTFGVLITPDLEARDLTIGRGLQASVNIVAGDLRTTEDLSIAGSTFLTNEEGADVDQRFESLAGTLTVGDLQKVTGGSLSLAAGAAVGVGDNPPISMEGDVIIEDGNLDIENGFTALADLEVEGTVSPTDDDGIPTREDRGILTIHGSDGAPVRSVLEIGADELSARVVVIESGTVLEKTEGSLAIVASRVDPGTLASDPTARLEMGGVLEVEGDLSLGTGGEMLLADTAQLTGDSIALSAGASGEGALKVGSPDGIGTRLHADRIQLRAGRIGSGQESETTTVVEVGTGVEFRDRSGTLAPESVIIQQSVPFSVADAPTDEDGVPVEPESYGSLPSLSQFGLDTLPAVPADGERGTMIYRVEAAKSALTLTGDLVSEILGGDAAEQAKLDLALVARDELNVLSDLNARELLLVSGDDSTADHDLTVGGEGVSTLALRADDIELVAGDSASESRVIFASDVTDITLRRTDDGGGDDDAAPDRFTLVQDAAIDDTTSLPDLADFGTLGADGLDYALVSTDADARLGTASIGSGESLQVLGGVDPDQVTGPGIRLRVESTRGDVELLESATSAAIEAVAGGDVRVGLHPDGEELADTSEIVTLAADEIGLTAGTFDDAAMVRIADSAKFQGEARGLPSSFAFRQSAAIDHSSLPSLSQFGSEPVANLSTMTYELVSETSIEVNDPSQIAGSDLVLIAPAPGGAVLNMAELDDDGNPILEGENATPTGATLALGSLTTCNANCESPDDTLLTVLGLTQSVDTQSGISLAGGVLFGSALVVGSDRREDRQLTAAAGDIAIEGTVSHGGGGSLSITASSGDVTLAGLVQTSSDVPVFGVVDDEGSLHGGDVTIHGTHATLSAIRTTSEAGESGDLAVTADEATGTITLSGDASFDLDASGSTPGNVTLTAAEIRVGSDEAGRTFGDVDVLGRDVTFAGDTVAQRPVPEEPEAGEEEVEAPPLEARSMRVGASGAVEFRGNVELDRLEVGESDIGSPSLVEFGGEVAIGTAENVDLSSAGELFLRADGDVDFGGNVEARRAFVDAGLDGTGQILLGQETAGISLGVEELRLRSHDNQALLDALDLSNVQFDVAPKELVLQQDQGFTAAEIVDVIDRAYPDPDATPKGARLGFLSNRGAVDVNAVDVNGTHLQLGAGVEPGDEPGEEPVEVGVTGALDVLTLNLDSDASFSDGVTVRRSGGGGTGVEGFDADGDITVLAGDLVSYSRVRMDGESELQSIDVQNGEFRAPAIERTTAEIGQEVAVTVAASGGIRLLGSFGERQLEDGPESARVRTGGSVVFADDTTALGDVVADQNVRFAAGAFFTSEHARARTQEEVDGGITPEPQDVGLDQNVEATNGVLTIGNPIAKPSGDLRLAAGAGYSIDCPLGCDTAVSTSDDLTLSGDGVLTGLGDTRRVESTGGDVTLEGSLEFAGELVIAAGTGEGDAIRTTDDGVQGASLVAQRIDLASDVEGEGSLTATADDIVVRKDVALGSGAALTLAASDGIAFAAPEAQSIESGSISLDPDGRETPLEATITGEGDLSLSATSGSFAMGRGSKLTTRGKLDINAAGDATISDLGAMEVSVSGSSIGVAGRGPADVTLPDLDGTGETVIRDGGVDVVANRVTFSDTPDSAITIGTPTTSEVSDSLIGDNVLVRTIFSSGRALTAEDFGCAGGLCDLVAQGSALFESSRQLAEMPPPGGPESFQLLRELNTVGVSARPPWAQELIAYLERASLGGDEPSPEFDDPRLSTPAVEKALRIYQGLFAPTSRFDDESGGQIRRSHRARIAAVLQQAEDDYRAERGELPTGESFLAYVSRGSRHGEALFYLSAFADLAQQAEAAGVTGDDQALFVRLLVEDVAPSGLGPEGLAAAVPFGPPS